MNYPPPPASPPPGSGYPGSPPSGPGDGPGGPGGPDWSPVGGSPYGAPQPPPKKSRTGMWIAIACGVMLLLVVVIGGGGVGAWLLLRSSGDGPTPTATSPAGPTGEPTKDPTDDPTAQPTDEPTDDPTDDPTDEPGTTTLTIRLASSEELDQVETNDGTLDPVNDTFFGAEIELTNEADEEIGLAGENFTFYDDQGDSHHVRYGRFTTSGPQIAPGETATAMIYADIPSSTQITEVSYTDTVGTADQEVTVPID